jgi:hypothetical protein
MKSHDRSIAHENGRPHGHRGTRAPRPVVVYQTPPPVVYQAPPTVV